MKFFARINRIDFLLILCLCLIALSFRLYKISTPLIEYHSWRQADTAAVARNYAREGINLLMPRYDDVSALQSGLPNPQGLRMVEFPLYNALIAVFYKAAPILPVEIWGRLVSTLLSLITILCIYAIAKRESGRLAAVCGGLLFAVYPFFVFYTRAILPEVMAATCAYLAVTLLLGKQTKLRIALSLLVFAMALLVKPTALFYAPAVAWLLLPAKRIHITSLMRIAGLMILTGLPLLAWRMYIKQFPEGIPASEWLLMYANTANGLIPVFMRPVFFRWIFYERLTVLILGVFSLPFFVVGTTTKTKSLLPLVLLGSSLLYLFTFQGGNVQHEYYQILILPTVAVIAGIGVSNLMQTRPHIFHKTLLALVIIASFGFGWLISWDKVHHYYYSLSDIPLFAKVVQTFVSPSERMVVDTAGDTTALYAFDRKGAPAIYGDTTTMRNDGYQYVFTYTHETAIHLMKSDAQVKKVFESEKFVLLKL